MPKMHSKRNKNPWSNPYFSEHQPQGNACAEGFETLQRNQAGRGAHWWDGLGAEQPLSKKESKATRQIELKTIAKAATRALL